MKLRERVRRYLASPSYAIEANLHARLDLVDASVDSLRLAYVRGPVEQLRQIEHLPLVDVDNGETRSIETIYEL